MGIYSDLFRLDGQNAIVTGAGRGIGEAILKALASAGCSVLAVSRSKNELMQVVDDIRNNGGEADFFVADITKEEDRAALMSYVALWKSRIDILVNVAGTSKPCAAADVTEAQWNITFDLNCKATFFLTQQIGKKMIESGRGKIINIISHLAIASVPGRVVYSASKAALMKMTEVLAVEWAPFNINVNSIAPSYTRTKLAMEVLKEESFKNFVLDNTPIRRISEPIDMCGAALFLASEASRMVTGQTIVVDGGWTAR